MFFPSSFFNIYTYIYFHIKGFVPTAEWYVWIVNRMYGHPMTERKSGVCFFPLKTVGDNDRALKVHAVRSCAKLFPLGVPFFWIQ